uniref:TNFR-Cys domain-containing protein n=1 Tax=Sphaeramia orbicularis TaxID=375764 RepID=A0A672YPA2_9TELE
IQPWTVCQLRLYPVPLLSLPLLNGSQLLIQYTAHTLQDCGFGDGGEGICIMCEQGTFSSDTSVAPCTRCTQCNLLNRLQKTGCSSTTDALCGQCLPG